jgi:hypothetical protein
MDQDMDEVCWDMERGYGFDRRNLDVDMSAGEIDASK